MTEVNAPFVAKKWNEGREKRARKKRKTTDGETKGDDGSDGSEDGEAGAGVQLEVRSGIRTASIGLFDEDRSSSVVNPAFGFNPDLAAKVENMAAQVEVLRELLEERERESAAQLAAVLEQLQRLEQRP